MGLLVLDAHSKRAGHHLYYDIRSWRWCALAYSGGRSTFLASGYWDIGSPAVTSLFRLTKGHLVPRNDLLRTEQFKELERACADLTETRRDFSCIEALRVGKTWKLKAITTNKVKR